MRKPRMTNSEREAATIAKAEWDALTETQKFVILETTVFPQEILLQHDQWKDGTLEEAFREIGRRRGGFNGFQTRRT